MADNSQCEIGVVGLGVMGRNLVLNMLDHGHRVACYDQDKDKITAMAQADESDRVRVGESVDAFVGLLDRPRAVLMLVPAGQAVDAVIGDVAPLLEEGDLFIDAGNSHFQDTEDRAKKLREKGLLYLGVGVSGGESGARYGPSIMPGGPREGYDRVRDILKHVAAKVDGDPCVTYLGPRSAGHYVKMVHNGIEYAIMQSLCEAYDLMRRGLGMNDDELHQVFDQWNQGELASYLVEITAQIFRVQDTKTGGRLIDQILDEAEQKGTGRWTSEDALHLGALTPTIDAAVSARNMSTLKEEREQAEIIYGQTPTGRVEDREVVVRKLKGALYAGMVLSFAQGMALLYRASREYKFYLQLADVARIWRGGCIIRAALLERIRAAFQSRADLQNLLLDREIGRDLKSPLQDLRSTVARGVGLGLPMPALTASLSYFDAYRSHWLPANLIQAQRDYFGRHTYERIDARGVFHASWSN